MPEGVLSSLLPGSQQPKYWINDHVGFLPSLVLINVPHCIVGILLRPQNHSLLLSSWSLPSLSFGNRFQKSEKNWIQKWYIENKKSMYGQLSSHSALLHNCDLWTFVGNISCIFVFQDVDIILSGLLYIFWIGFQNIFK